MNSSTGKRAAKATRLSKEDWCAAGLQMLAQRGASGVRIDALCAALQVTKGSFYWHFSDRDDFLHCLFTFWNTKATKGMIDMAEAQDGPADQRIWKVVEEITLGDYDEGAEIAMRLWAIEHQGIRDKLLEVDTARIGFFARNLEQLGHDAAAAKERGTAIYSLTLALSFMQTGEDAETLRTRLQNNLSMIVDG